MEIQVMWNRFALILTTSLISVPASAGPVFSSAGNGYLRPDQINAAYLRSLKSLRTEALNQQRRDGGTLTPRHLADFQKRLDRTNDLHRRTMTNYNPLTVDADGHPNNVRPDQDWTWSRLVRGGAPG
jgi:hypothetical protein